MENQIRNKQTPNPEVVSQKIPKSLDEVVDTTGMSCPLISTHQIWMNCCREQCQWWVGNGCAVRVIAENQMAENHPVMVYDPPGKI